MSRDSYFTCLCQLRPCCDTTHSTYWFVCDEPAVDISLTPLLSLRSFPSPLLSVFLGLFLCFWGVLLCQALPFPCCLFSFFFDEPVSARKASSSPLIGWSMSRVFLPAFYSGRPGSVNWEKPKEPLSLDQGTALMSTQSVRGDEGSERDSVNSPETTGHG